ncbi:ABC transporter substrate-binding protein [Bacillus sp. Bva_UNVM-123]|uniref:ABC transporter substrate-binding protein n=1 Tax=Bacillus sp. Bva_UNVM-123 TaxID=2829798 RepID=UPI00391F090F
MKIINKMTRIFFSILIISIFTACSTKTSEFNRKEESLSEDKVEETRTYTDYLGHVVTIPTSPERVIYHGEGFGDLLALNVNAVGGGFSWITDYAWEERVKNVEDVGFPINVEKTLALMPDLIIIATSDEKTYEQLSKIAPTIVFDSFAPIEQRVPELGDILGKKVEATKWLSNYKQKADKMWEKLIDDGTIQPNETASVLTFYPGNRLFVMARAGLSQVLYDTNGFIPNEKIQDILDEDKGFEEISVELLHEYAGDRIFILTPVDEEAQMI